MNVSNIQVEKIYYSPNCKPIQYTHFSSKYTWFCAYAVYISFMQMCLAFIIDIADILYNVEYLGYVYDLHLWTLCGGGEPWRILLIVLPLLCLICIVIMHCHRRILLSHSILSLPYLSILLLLNRLICQLIEGIQVS